jgi:uncharacterized protein DUF4307
MLPSRAPEPGAEPPARDRVLGARAAERALRDQPVLAVGDNGPVTRTEARAGLTPEEAARLRRRYPRSRVPRPVAVALVALLAAVGLGWLIWAAAFHSRPAVAADVAAFTVVSDTLIKVTVTVDRLDPAVPATCRVRVQATDFQTVGEQTLQVPPGTVRLVDAKLDITTIRRATSASVAECSAG